MNTAFHRLVHSRSGGAQFARYLVIGSTVFLIDIGSFQLLVRLGALLAVATALSYMVGISSHFALNRYLNFRTFERSLGLQARTYFVIALAQLPVAIAIVEAGVHFGRLAPLEAKVVAVVMNVPLSFVAHKYLTFGGGIRKTFRELVR